MKPITHWDREFQVWQYSVSHSKLLLRSFDPDEYETRIDVLFPAVELMMLRPAFETLAIQELSTTEAQDFLVDRRAPQPQPWGTLYVINDGEGYVQAASCKWHEDEGDHHTPSRFGPLRGTE
ncbi:hypothetical protein ITI46_26710 [Streptomyces oryzae]|uniref:Uncharacterized protein n=1 Tax=Streptomyces oryzae TaxID=1434886 RepID=A0ABS3XIH8_9ACTN|nr:hypothetical protein [Streptomyces oryzae]MBO8195213.1 hypothetical protein [Streptomyces oryzae]